MSAGAPPGASRAREGVVVAGRSVPGTAGSTRMAHVRRLLTSRGYVWAVALVSGAGFLYGAATEQLNFAVGVPVSSVVAAVALAYFTAMREAALDFYKGFADNHGYSYTPNLELMETTPLLGAGDRRHCDHYMEGPLSPELPAVRVGLAHYTYETSSERRMRRNRTVEVWTPYKFTIAVVELPSAIEEIPGVFLGQRRGMFGRISGEAWLDYDRLRSFELESSDLADKYELYVRKNMDETRLMELFQPSFQVWLGRLPIPLCFEFSGGTLVVYLHKQLEEAGSLEIMLQATAHIAKRILTESATQRGPVRSVPGPPASVPPPTGQSAPPPVPAAPTLEAVPSPPGPPPGPPPASQSPPAGA